MKTGKRFFALLLALAVGMAVPAFADSTIEAGLPTVTISYSENGTPILDDSAANAGELAASGVMAAAVTETWAYHHRNLNSTFFLIPAGKVVAVLETDTNYGSAKITYAGYTCWVSSSNLRLGD